MVMKWVFVVLTWLALDALCADSFDFDRAITLTAAAGAVGVCITSDMASRWEDRHR